MCLLVAGEEGAVFALEELLPPMAVPVVTAEALHVAGAELTELTGEDGVGPTVAHRRRASVCRCRRLLQGQLVVIQLLPHVGRLQVPRVCGASEGRAEVTSEI